jgi:transcriptional regulator with XRE-family HTH domain
MSRRVQQGFGDRLRAARTVAPSIRRGQRELAGVLEVSRTSVSNIERGRHRVFLDQVYAAARALGVPIADLLPSLDEVFPGPIVHSAPDSPLAADSMQKVSDLARTLQDTLGTPKPKRSRRTPTATR